MQCAAHFVVFLSFRAVVLTEIDARSILLGTPAVIAGAGTGGVPPGVLFVWWVWDWNWKRLEEAVLILG